MTNIPLGNQAVADEDSGIQPNAARDLQKFLKEEGYITSTSCAQQRGRVASRRTTLVAVSSGPDYNKMLSELFDPLMHISHLVSFFCCP